MSGPNFLNDAAMVDLDEKIEALIKSCGLAGCPVDRIQNELGDLAVARAGVLTGKGILTAIGGGGADPYILTIAD